MRISIYIATSFDRFIARPDGDVDWLTAASQEAVKIAPNEDYGYQALFSSIDCMVMGRNSFEKVLSFGIEWPYAGKRFIILSTTMTNPPDEYKDRVECYGGSLDALVEQLAADGIEHIYIDGGKTIQSFLNAGLVSEMIVTTIPILLGEGIPLFGSLPHDIHLTHVRTDSYPSGFVQSHYQIAKG